MVSIFQLPRHVLVRILCEWIRTDEVGRIDCSLSSHKFRIGFHSIFKLPGVALAGMDYSQKSSLKVTRKYSTHFIEWIVSRDVKLKSIYFFIGLFLVRHSCLYLINKSCTVEVTINFYDRTFKQLDAESVANFLNNCPKLNSLTFKNCSSLFFLHVFSNLSVSTLNTITNWQANVLNFWDLDKLVSSLELLSNGGNMRELKLEFYNTNTNRDDITVNNNEIINFLHKNRQLEILSLSHVGYGICSALLECMATYGRHLRTVQLNSKTFHGQADSYLQHISVILEHCMWLESFQLHFISEKSVPNVNFTKSVLDASCTSSAKKQTNSIELVYPTSNRIHHCGLNAFLTTKTDFTHIKLAFTDVTITNNLLQTIANTQKQLVSLDFNDQTGYFCASADWHYLFKHSLTLTTLKMHCLNLHPKKIESIFAEQNCQFSILQLDCATRLMSSDLVKVLVANANIKTLVLHKCRINRVELLAGLREVGLEEVEVVVTQQDLR